MHLDLISHFRRLLLLPGFVSARFVPMGMSGCKASFYKSFHFLPYKWGHPPLVMTRAAGGHTSGWALCATSNFYAESTEGRLFPHTLEINMTLKQSEPASVGEAPYNMLVIFLQFFWLFLFFSLKSIDRHKNPGNATKEKTNVQLRSKNPELRRRRGAGLLGVQEGLGGAVPMGQLATGDPGGR